MSINFTITKCDEQMVRAFQSMAKLDGLVQGKEFNKIIAERIELQEMNKARKQSRPDIVGIREEEELLYTEED